LPPAVVQAAAPRPPHLHERLRRRAARGGARGAACHCGVEQRARCLLSD
jgi:hypothetical protein